MNKNILKATIVALATTLIATVAMAEETKRGKGQGRSENGWRNPRLVINQARWILRLRKLYPTLNDLYFPLQRSSRAIHRIFCVVIIIAHIWSGF